MRPAINPTLVTESQRIARQIAEFQASGGVIEDCTAPGCRPLNTPTAYNGRPVSRERSARGGATGRRTVPIRLSATEHSKYISTAEFCRSPGTKDSLLPLSRTHWWRGVHNGTYPSPDFVIGRTALWRRDQIAAIAEKLGGGKP